MRDHPQESHDLDERKAAVLRAIVEHYVETGQPVGSRTVSERSDLGVSPATVRNEMSVLERDGYITHPHTSAGRIPTDSGYRYYVDHLAGVARLPAAERRRVVDFFTSTARTIDELLAQTSQLLAGLTAHAAVVVGPQPEAARVRSITLVRLQPRVLMIVVVCSNGSVQKEVLALGADVDEEVVHRVGASLARALEGLTLGDAAAFEPPGGTEPETVLAAEVCAALRTHLVLHPGEPLFVGGAARLAAEHEAFPGSEGAARLLELLEQHTIMASLLRELLGPGLTVRIGSEHERAELRACSLVLAPFVVEGEAQGSIGVLGPTRMDYRKAQAAVAAVSQQLGRQLSS